MEENPLDNMDDETLANNTLIKFVLPKCLSKNRFTRPSLLGIVSDAGTMAHLWEKAPQ